jgi:NAD(P)H-dependent FMN reductase
MSHILIEGSARPDSQSGRVAAVVGDALHRAGAETEHLAPADYLAALTEGAVAGEPTEAFQPVVERVAAADSAVLVTPEYHGSFSGIIKLVLDNLGYPSVLKGKPVAVVSLGASRFCGPRPADGLNSVLAHMRARPLGRFLFVPSVYQQLTPEGELADPELAGEVATFVDELLRFAHCVGPG